MRFRLGGTGMERKVRLVADSIEPPQTYRDDSFFGLQGQATAEDRK